MELVVAAFVTAVGIVTAGGWRAAARAAEQRCEDLLAEAHVLLDEGRAAAAIERFAMARQAAQWGALLPAPVRAAFACRAAAGCARAHLLAGGGDNGLAAAEACAACARAEACPAVSRPLARLALVVSVDVLAALAARAAQLGDWVGAIRHAAGAASLAGGCDDEATRAVADAALTSATDGALAAAESATRRGEWAMAGASAGAVLACACAGQAVLARARATAAAAHADECAHHTATAELALASRDWAAAAAHAARASALADAEFERARAAAAAAAAATGAFNDVLARAAAATAAQQWVESLALCDEAARVAPPNDVHAAAGVARARAAVRAGRLADSLLVANRHLAASRWREAERAASEAEAHADATADKQHARNVAARARTAARAAELARHLAAAEAYMVAGRWCEAETAAVEAERFADARESMARVRDTAVRARESAALEPDYLDDVDSFIRRRRKSFRSDDPTGFACPLAAIAQNCPKPACLTGSLASLLARHPDMFRVEVVEGGQVRVTTLTPFRGAPSHRVWGEFRCPCGKTWASAASYCDIWQQCKACNKRVYPYTQRPLDVREEDERDADEERRPHDMERCERCRRLGRCCLPMGDKVGGARSRPGGGRGGYDGNDYH